MEPQALIRMLKARPRYVLVPIKSFPLKLMAAEFLLRGAAPQLLLDRLDRRITRDFFAYFRTEKAESASLTHWQTVSG
jgi:hypothetical protein